MRRRCCSLLLSSQFSPTVRLLRESSPPAIGDVGRSDFVALETTRRTEAAFYKWSPTSSYYFIGDVPQAVYWLCANASLVRSKRGGRFWRMGSPLSLPVVGGW